LQFDLLAQYGRGLLATHRPFVLPGKYCVCLQSIVVLRKLGGLTSLVSRYSWSTHVNRLRSSCKPPCPVHDVSVSDLRMGSHHARSCLTDSLAMGMQGMTALHMAAHQGFSAIVNHIASALANRDDINLPDNLGQTALHHAAALGHGDTVDSLWKMKGSLDAADNQGWTGAKACNISVDESRALGPLSLAVPAHLPFVPGEQ
jgi:hypothetical protein